MFVTQPSVGYDVGGLVAYPSIDEESAHDEQRFQSPGGRRGRQVRGTRDTGTRRVGRAVVDVNVTPFEIETKILHGDIVRADGRSPIGRREMKLNRIVVIAGAASGMSPSHGSQAGARCRRSIPATPSRTMTDVSRISNQPTRIERPK